MSRHINQELVRRHYATAASNALDEDYGAMRSDEQHWCGTSGCAPTFGAELYGGQDDIDPASRAIEASLGCGVPTAVADLEPGDTVLDLGSGAGGDVLISARRVAPGGRAIGVDMTPEMIVLARRNAADAGVTNVEFVEGHIEDLPLPDDSIDVVISNCVLNLTTDRARVTREAFRVLRPGGTLAVSDVVASESPIEESVTALRDNPPLPASRYEAMLIDAGFSDLLLAVTHPISRAANAVTVRATKPLHSSTDEPETIE